MDITQDAVENSPQHAIATKDQGSMLMYDKGDRQQTCDCMRSHVIACEPHQHVHARPVPTRSFREVHQKGRCRDKPRSSHSHPDTQKLIGSHAWHDVRANSKDGSHRRDRGERGLAQDRDGRNDAGKRSDLTVIGWQLRIVGPGSEGSSRSFPDTLGRPCGERKHCYLIL